MNFELRLKILDELNQLGVICVKLEDFLYAFNYNGVKKLIDISHLENKVRVDLEFEEKANQIVQIVLFQLLNERKQNGFKQFYNECYQSSD